MRLLLASNRLEVPGGSETYLLTLGVQLQRLGHEVVVVEGPGGEGTLAAEAGLRSVRSPEGLEVAPERILVQDSIVAGELAAAWPGVPQVLVVHSGLHDLQMAGALPSSVAALITLNDRLADLSRGLAEGRPVHRLRQPVDVGHFTPGPPPAPIPSRVLLYGNNRTRWRTDDLLDACADRGIEVVRVGAAAGRIVQDPVRELRDADIVIGYGRCVIEAMACGRTAFVFDRFGSDGWVTAETYPALEATGFAGLADLDEPGRHRWAEVLDAYDPRHGDTGHDLALRHHHAKTHAREVIGILEGLGPVVPAEPGTAFALARTWREQWRWERRALGWAGELDEARSTLRDQEAELAKVREELDAARGHLRALEDQVEAVTGELEAVRRTRSFRAASLLARMLRPWRRSPSAG